MQALDQTSTMYFTLDGTLPTTNSAIYSGAIHVGNGERSYSRANAFEAGYVNSVAATATFTSVPPLYNLFAPTLLDDGSFQFQYWAPPGTYVLEGTTDFVNWVPLGTNTFFGQPVLLDGSGSGGDAI